MSGVLNTEAHLMHFSFIDGDYCVGCDEKNCTSHLRWYRDIFADPVGGEFIDFVAEVRGLRRSQPVQITGCSSSDKPFIQRTEISGGTCTAFEGKKNVPVSTVSRFKD
jgi:hypothetical protein